MRKNVHLFTSAGLNYLGKVQTLFGSVRRYHPEFTLHLVLAERRIDHVTGLLEAAGGPCRGPTFVTDLPAGRRPGWLFGHTLVELATAIKTHFVLELLRRPDCDRVLYLDPDIAVFSRLDDVLAALDDAAIALTPHLLRPDREPQAIADNELSALRHGAFNLGFLGLANVPQSHSFAAWWRDRVDEYCIDALADGLFTDQKWIDLAPGFFDQLVILRQPRLNVAPWNLGQRSVTGSFDEGFLVDGQPLGFYHFTGFDSGAHHVMAARYAPGNRAVQMLIDWYTDHTASMAPRGPVPWSLACFDDGTPIPLEARRRYRSRPDLQHAFPNPYPTGPGSYREWLESGHP